MDRYSVNSTNLSSIGYDEETSTLEVAFNSGLVYHFYGVPFLHFDGLLRAGSAGKYFDRFIRKSSYNYRPVGGMA